MTSQNPQQSLETCLQEYKETKGRCDMRIFWSYVGRIPDKELQTEYVRRYLDLARINYNKTIPNE